MRTRVWIVFLCLAAACSQRVTPEEEYARQARERPLLPASDAVPVEAPAAGPTMGTAAGGASDADIEVTIETAPGGAGDGGVLFVFVRPAGVTAGPPLAVQRISSPRFPLTLTIGPANAMMPGTEFPDLVTVQARLDQDGDAMTEGSADGSAASDPIAPGGTVRLLLERDAGS